MRLVGTTKPTISADCERSHWECTEPEPRRIPSTFGPRLGRSTSTAEVKKAARRLDRDRKHWSGKGRHVAAHRGNQRRRPSARSRSCSRALEEQREETEQEEQARVFAKLKGLSGGERVDEDEFDKN